MISDRKVILDADSSISIGLIYCLFYNGYPFFNFLDSFFDPGKDGRSLLRRGQGDQFVNNIFVDCRTIGFFAENLIMADDVVAVDRNLPAIGVSRINAALALFIASGH